MSNEPLWTDAKIASLTFQNANNLDPDARSMHEQITKDMRNDYERALAFQNEDIGRLQQALKGLRDQSMQIADNLERVMRERDVAQARIAELEAAIDGCAGQWTPMPEGAHYCGCNDEDCTGEWRIENNGSRLVIGDGESELSIEFYEAIRVCWQIQPAT